MSLQNTPDEKTAARRHLCVQFVFQFSNFNFSGEEAGDQSGGAAAADTISTPCPQHTSLRDSLDQKRVPENFVFLGEISIQVSHKILISQKKNLPKCPQHTSLRDSLDQKRVPKKLSFWVKSFYT